MSENDTIRAGHGTNSVEVIARGLFHNGSSVLVCRSIQGGYSYLPGGHIEVNESAAQACTREFLEETGIPVRAGDCLLVCEVFFEQGGEPHHEINLVFHVEHLNHASLTEKEIRKAVKSQERHIAFDWIDLAAVSDLDLRPTAIRAWLMSGGEITNGPTPHWFSTRE